MAIYIEAAAPGSSIPNPRGMGGAVVPSLVPRGFPPELSGVSGFLPVASFTNAPSFTTGPLRKYGAEIAKSAPPIGPSVTGTLFSATPLANITSVFRDLPHAARRPFLPAGLRERVAETLPPGLRQRATVWTRAVARWRSVRPTSGGRVHRE